MTHLISPITPGLRDLIEQALSAGLKWRPAGPEPVSHAAVSAVQVEAWRAALAPKVRHAD